MPPCIFNSRVTVDVGQQAEAESVAVVGGICEAINEHAGGGGLERLSDTIVELVVNNRTPVLGLLVGHWLHICTGSTLTGHRSEISLVQTDADAFKAHLTYFGAHTRADEPPGPNDTSISAAIVSYSSTQLFLPNYPL